MMDLGKHAAVVLAAWGISLALLAGLTVQTLAAAARARRELKRVDPRG